MMFEVCRSRTLDKTNLFLLAFLHATGLALVNKAITKKRIAILTNETASLLSLTLGTIISISSIIFFIIRENKNSKQKIGGIYKNLNFDDCSHEYPELSVPGN